MSGRGNILVASSVSPEPQWLMQIAQALAERGFTIAAAPSSPSTIQTSVVPADVKQLLARADIIVTTPRSQISHAMLEHAPMLRGVVFPTVGTESIDLPAATALGILVAHGPTPENFVSMAEATVMLMLVLMYDLHASERMLREHRPRPQVMHAQMLAGKTVGLVGLGRIARAVMDRLSGWGVKFLAIDRPSRGSPAPEGVELVAFEELLRRSDIVSLHTTLTPETRHMMGPAQFALMKPTAFFMNTSRGGLVDEEALYDALKQRRIAGAALDTFAQEPLPADNPLRTLDNVLLTPHIVGQTRETMAAIPGALLQNVENIMRGERPLYWRNPEAEPAWRRRMATLATRGVSP